MKGKATANRNVMHSATACIALCMLMFMLMLTGCTHLTRPDPGEDDYRSVAPLEALPPVATNGSIYQAGHEIVLFEDVKARRVGDTLTVLLRERTDAEKEASTDIDKSSNSGFSVDSSGLANTPVDVGGVFGVPRSLDASHSTDFSGSGSTDQSNQLSGEITVTVARVLANGNLEVQGEKWIEINHGEEYIRLRGIVRPADIGPNNMILSNRIANARIAYSGKGSIPDSNLPGILTRFFLSVLLF